MSIRYKIALLFAALVSVILLLLGTAVYLYSSQERANAFRVRLKGRALTTAGLISGASDSGYAVLYRLDSAGVASLYERSITVLDSRGRYVYLNADLPGDTLYFSPEVREQAMINGLYEFRFRDKPAVAVYASTAQGTHHIVGVAARDANSAEYLQQLKHILLGALIVSVFLSFFTGLFFARTLTRQLSRITAQVNRITSRNLSERLEAANGRDELAHLSTTFNHLLDRLEESFAIQRRFISNASHELSTPLTAVSSQLEVALQKDRPPEEYREVMRSVYEDVMELQQLTRSLLDIARTGSQGAIELSEVRLDEVLFKVAADVQRQNPGYKVHFAFDSFPEDERLLTVFGNSNLLYMAFKNIIENGCKYAANQQSDVTARFGLPAAEVTVHNVGDVIAEADIQQIFQPFFRSEQARQKPGFGLGLTLTRRILALHKGTIAVESGPDKGTRFSITLPVSA